MAPSPYSSPRSAKVPDSATVRGVWLSKTPRSGNPVGKEAPIAFSTPSSLRRSASVSKSRLCRSTAK